jgi:hypothetical protein
MCVVTDLVFAPVSLAEMNMELQDIASGLTTLEKELDRDDYKDGNHPTTFVSVMSVFHDEAKKRYTELDDLRKDMQSSYDALVRFYGEDPGKMAPDEFFGIFSTFVTSWEVSSLAAFRINGVKIHVFHVYDLIEMLL